MDYKRVAEYIKDAKEKDREIVLIFLKTNREISEDIIKSYLKSLGIKGEKREVYRRTLKRFLSFIEKKKAPTPFAETLLRELYVDEKKILRIRFSGVPALAVHAAELEGLADFNKRSTIRARSAYRRKKKCTGLSEV